MGEIISEVFVSNLEELQEINLVPAFAGALFRDARNVKYTAMHPEQEMTKITHILNQFLLKKETGDLCKSTSENVKFAFIFSNSARS